MSDYQNGGPAFPVPPGVTTFTGDPRDGAGYEPSQEGMTLRDYFASKALNGILSSLAVSETESVVMVTNRGGIDKFQKRIAQCAFEYADAMLAARAGKEVSHD